MKVRILRNYGSLKKDEIIDVNETNARFMLENGIACVAPEVKKDDCNDDCDDCEDCKGKNKKSQPAPKKAPAKKQSTTKKKTTKKPASKK
jgi:hypothetical protein